MNVAQASVWNVGTCCFDDKGARQVEDIVSDIFNQDIPDS